MQNRAVVAGPPPAFPPIPGLGELRKPEAVLPRATVPSRRNMWCRLVAAVDTGREEGNEKRAVKGEHLQKGTQQQSLLAAVQSETELVR